MSTSYLWFAVTLTANITSNSVEVEQTEGRKKQFGSTITTSVTLYYTNLSFIHIFL